MTTLTDKLKTLESLYDIDPNYFVNGGEYLREWYEWHNWAIKLSYAYPANYFTLTDVGVKAIDQAYDDWLSLTANDEQEWDWSEFFPFNEWTKPQGVINA